MLVLWQYYEVAISFPQEQSIKLNIIINVISFNAERI